MTAGGARAKVVAVTGAAGAIGGATVRRFLDAGFAVVGLDRQEPSDEADGHEFRQVDLLDADAVERVFRELRSAGTLHHVVGIAGGALPGEPPTQNDPRSLDLETFRSSVELNLVTQFSVVRAALPWLRKAPDVDRSITLTSSFNALTGCGMPAYSAAKAGLIGMMHALATPLGREGIRINVVAPGTIRTPRTERLWSRMSGHFERLEASTILRRLGEPDDVARCFRALATEMTHVTGQVIVVDGGQTVFRDYGAGASPSDVPE